jgi:hypothetical protein
VIVLRHTGTSRENPRFVAAAIVSSGPGHAAEGIVGSSIEPLLAGG